MEEEHVEAARAHAEADEPNFTAPAGAGDEAGADEPLLEAQDGAEEGVGADVPSTGAPEGASVDAGGEAGADGTQGASVTQVVRQTLTRPFQRRRMAWKKAWGLTSPPQAR